MRNKESTDNSIYSKLCEYFRNFRDFENIIYKHSIPNMREAWRVSKNKKMSRDEFDRLIGQPIPTEGYISRSKLYVPRCPYYGKNHEHDDMKYDTDKHLGTISTNRAKCEFFDCCRVTIITKEAILERNENEKNYNNKIMISFMLFNKWTQFSDLTAI